MSKMITRAVLLLALTVSAAEVVAQGDDARQQIDEAVRFADRGQLDRSEALLREVLVSDTMNYCALYELARVYYLKKDFENVVELARRAVEHVHATDEIYQLLGNAFDTMGASEKSLAVYERGIEKFPASGRLYWELGKLAGNGNDYLRAMDYYERGIAAEPDFAPNYYDVATIFLSSSERVWGMMYGEIFMLLEREGPRMERMSRFLYDGYRAGISIETGENPGERSMNADFSRNSRVEHTEDGQLILPFGKGVYESLLSISFPKDAPEVSLDALDRMRRNFVRSYFVSRDRLRGRLAVGPGYPNVLFDFQRRAAEAGHAEAYNYWVLRYGDTAKFDEWRSSHKRQWKAFRKWFAAHPLILDREQCFNRLQYEDVTFTEN